MNKNDIRKLINNNPWFARYYDFEELNITGLRDNIQRQKIYNQHNFKGAKILDVGCNLGKNFLYLYKKSPKAMVGLDLEYTINTARKINNFYKVENVKYISTNLNNKKWYQDLIKKSGISKFDYSLFVSVYGTKELYNRNGILKDIIKNTKKSIFFEGHHLENHKKYSQILLEHSVQNFKFEGYLRDKNNDLTSDIRPFFTISNEGYEKNDIFEHIKNIKSEKGRVIVGIEGLAGTGKTTLVSEIYKLFNKSENILIIDDLKSNIGKKYTPTNSIYKIVKYKIINFIKRQLNLANQTESLNKNIFDKTYDVVIISDYKLRKYVDDVNILITMQTEEKNRIKRIFKRDGKNKNYSKKIIKSNNFSCDNLYTIIN